MSKMKFIVIDGIDGSGKDTQAKLIYNEFLKKEKKKEELGKKAKKIVLRSHPNEDNVFGRISHYALLKEGKANVFIAATFYFFDVIRSLLIYYPQSDVLIFSRYLLAIIYLPSACLIPFYNFFSFVLPNTEHKYFLNVSPDEAMARVLKRSSCENIGQNENISSANVTLNNTSNTNNTNDTNNNSPHTLQTNKLQIFENEKSLKKCSKKALLITKDWNIINGNKELNDVTNEIKTCLFLEEK
ncbi:MAG: hypothetical protein ACRC1M_01490 [Methanobacteriaceae archaeon]